MIIETHFGVIFMQLLYLDCVYCDCIDIERTRPVICQWKTNYVKIREDYEKKEIGKLGTGPFNKYIPHKIMDRNEMVFIFFLLIVYNFNLCKCLSYNQSVLLSCFLTHNIFNTIFRDMMENEIIKMMIMDEIKVKEQFNGSVLR